MRYSGTFGEPQIFRINSDGTGIRQLTTNLEGDEHPRWSPDGSRIAFEREYRQGGESYSAIYVMDPDGANLLKVGAGLGGDNDPKWSPDRAESTIVTYTS